MINRTYLVVLGLLIFVLALAVAVFTKKNNESSEVVKTGEIIEITSPEPEAINPSGGPIASVSPRPSASFGTTGTTTTQENTTKGGVTDPKPNTNSTSPTFNLRAYNFAFSQTELHVKKGDTVVINLENTGGTHDFSLDAFNVRSSVTKTGQKTSVKFVADKTGTFEYYCSQRRHKAEGMVGKLVVE